MQNRLVSAEMVITDFQTQRVPLEIEIYSKLCETTRQLLERALSNKVITLGETSLEEVGWWMENQLITMGMNSTFDLAIPMIIHSEKSNEHEYRTKEYVIQRGDLMQYDFSTQHMNMRTDFK